MKFFIAAPALLAVAAAQVQAQGAIDHRGGLLFSTPVPVKGQSGKSKSSKKKKSSTPQDSMLVDIPSCPNFIADSISNAPTTSKGGKSGKRRSTKKSAPVESNTCLAQGSVPETVTCGATYMNTALTLSGDLYCDGDVTFITMEGPGAILDCNNFKLANVVPGEGVGVELVDGASIVNCNIANVNNAVVTSGDGCTTIQNVAAAFTDGDSFLIQNTGTTIMTDIKVDTSDDDGIEIGSNGSGSTQLVVINNADIYGTYNDGIDLLTAASSGTTVQLYGDVTLRANEDDGINISGERFDLKLFGSLTILGSDGEGLDVDTSSQVTVTFAAGSSTAACFSFGDDFESNSGNNPFIVEDGAFLVCDTVEGGATIVCDAACVPVPAGEMLGETTACLA